MTSAPAPTTVRIASVADAAEVATLLHAFNIEFETETPGTAVLAQRLAKLLAEDTTFCVAAGEPIVGLGLVTLRTNVWFDGPVALLDEFYVIPELRGNGIGTQMLATIEHECRRRGVEYLEINVDEGDTAAQRFYIRHGYQSGSADERELYFAREL